MDHKWLRAYLIAKLVEVVDEGAGAGCLVRLLLLDYVEGSTQELTTADGGGEEHAVVEYALIVALNGMVEVRPVDEDSNLLRSIRPFHSIHSGGMLPEKGISKIPGVSPPGAANMLCSGCDWELESSKVESGARAG